MTDQELKDLVASLAVANRETALQMKETDRKLAEYCEKLDRLSEKLDKINSYTSDDTDHQTRQTSKFSQDILSESLTTEQFFEDALRETLIFAGIEYNKICLDVERKKGKIPDCKFDVMLVNSKNVAIIEVKNRIHHDFVKELAEKKAVKFRKFFPEYANCKLYLGVAGFSFCGAVVEEAKKYGVGIIRQVGKSIEVDSKYMKAY